MAVENGGYYVYLLYFRISSKFCKQVLKELLETSSKREASGFYLVPRFNF
jgi:hypothetical protein